MGKYKKCPRCELNWIPADEELCEVCKAELGKASSISLLEDEDDEDEIYEDRICPVCKVNYLNDDEDICASCKAERLSKKSSRAEEEIEQDVDDDDESWKEYVDNDNLEDDVSLQLLQDDELNETFDDEEAPVEPDDFDDDEIPPFDDTDDDTIDDDEDEEEDEEDF